MPRLPFHSRHLNLPWKLAKEIEEMEERQRKFKLRKKQRKWRRAESKGRIKSAD